jgi:hypothetical protein
MLQQQQRRPAAASHAGAGPTPPLRPAPRPCPQVGAAKEAAKSSAGQKGGGRWATVGVLAAKATAVTKKGDNYSRWTISDLGGAEVGGRGGQGRRGRRRATGSWANQAGKSRAGYCWLQRWGVGGC